MNIADLINKNNDFRTSCINLIASENVLSEQAKQALTIQHARYHADFYGGTTVFEQIFQKTTQLAEEVFQCKTAFVTPLSGNMADIAVLLAFTSFKDKLAMLPLSVGGYPLNVAYFRREKLELPFNLDVFNINVEATLDLLKKEKPQMILLGSSFFLFPHPIAPIAEVVHDYGGLVVYDASHVLGLLAGERFQQPLKEGADIVVSSTHKSFPGPQGGLIMTKGDTEIDRKIEEVVGKDPLNGIVLVDNIHNANITSLGVTLEEMKDHGDTYATQIVKNGRALAQKLYDEGIPIYGKDQGFTESHQVIVDIGFDYQAGQQQRDRLAQFNIITDSALRFGQAEVTRLGYKEQEMSQLGRYIADILNEENPPEQYRQEILQNVKQLVEQHQEVIL